MSKRTCPNADANSSEAREPSPKRSRPDPSGESSSNPAAPSTSTDIAEPLSTVTPQSTSNQGSTPSAVSMKSYTMRLIQKEVQHKNIVKYLDDFEILDEGMKHHALRLEVLGPTVEKVFDPSLPKFHPNVLKSVITQVLKAVKYIHGINIVHMDIKSNNVMIVINEENIREIANSNNVESTDYRMDLTSAKSTITVKLGDFGIAFNKGKSDHHPQPACTYCAPESFLTTTIDFPIDMWSMGCMIYKIVTRHPLLKCDQKEGHEQKDMPKMAKALGPIPGALFQNSQRPEYKDYFGVKDCIDCGTPDVHGNFVRAASEYLNHEDALHFSEFTRRCLKYDPKERLTAAEALDDKFLVPHEVDLVHGNEIPPHSTEPAVGQPATSQ
uniref:Protein kinase domain-containing protein n=1 Tax=Caenorhabditis tropicalis TaxID=1561998 RepID=A0A1I7TP09_9PELO